MNRSLDKSLLKNSFAGIGATVAAAILGYFATQYFGKYMMLGISTGVFGLGAAIHRTQQLVHQKPLPQTFLVTEPKAEVTQSDKEVKHQDSHSRNKSPAKASLRSITSTSASRFSKTQVKITKFSSKSQSFGYCRKRLALCHQAKIKNSTSNILKD